MKTVRELFASEPAAILEAALDQSITAAPAELSARRGRLAVVDVRGPLLQRAGSTPFGAVDGYDAIEARFGAALQSDASAVLLRIDSPGGVVPGCFEAVGRMRAAAMASDKPVLVYVDELAASAAYAIACVATAGIFVPKSGRVGSVGALAVHASSARALEKEGVDVRVFRSGKRKAEGSSVEALTDDAAKAMQARVDGYGQQFAELVASARGMSTTDVLAHEGALLDAQASVKAGLADHVGSLEDAAFHAVSMGSMLDRSGPQPRAAVAASVANLSAAPDAVASARRDLLVRVAVAQAVAEERLDVNDQAAVIELGTTIGVDKLRAHLARFPSPVASAVASVVDKACSDGKIAPADRESWTSAGMQLGAVWLASTVGRLGPVVPGATIVPAHIAPVAEFDAMLAGKLGLSRDDYRAANALPAD